MEESKQHVSCLRSRTRVFLLALGTFIIVCAAVIPAAVVTTLHKKHNMGPKSKVFIPLYVYPDPGAWSPLEKVISAHPHVNFTVVINPGNGPGPDALPDANYTREVPILASYANVRLLGYVHTTYATRNISLLHRDIETYAAWPTKSSNPNLAVRGIFFDETPQAYSDHALDYLQNLTELTKGLNGLGSDPFIVHNPGAVPDSRYLTSADSTVVFEGTYSTFQERLGAKIFTAIPDSNRTELCAVLHSIPSDVTGSQLRSLVKQVRGVSDEIFMTHLSDDYYASFGPQWAEFVDQMAA
ncbi:hypothetical protein N7495_009529 [Penicillium taxi]|uniref:uncharacterized protein n=1 Tax=Penicillium taxi TaxID=168475 RepID=UPI00254589DD|nr:uncharacterized protein N7495_009529 [Penicillium taxi]KAJ5885019.1 hypothetical protein N7495_009529 [Penicillium taxi]